MSSASLSPVLKQATPVVVDHASGSWIHGTDGRRYLDFTTGIGVTSTGHCHPDVVAAAQEQCAKIIHAQYTTVMHQPLLRLTEKLGEHLPDGIDSVFYANSGSEAVEAAVRLARMATRRQYIVTVQRGFHGRTVAAASLTSAGTKFSAGFGPLMAGVATTPFPDALRLGLSEDEAVDYALKEFDYLLGTRIHPDELAAVLIEPVLGDGGYLAVPPAYLAGLRERTRRHGALLVLDEVQAGVGRTGRFWGHQHTDGLVPDVIITAKGIASGFPISAIAAPEAIMAKAWPGSQGGTYGGNAVAAAAGVATLEVIEREGLVENARVRGAQLLDGLRAGLDGVDEICDIRGTGLMLAVEFGDPTANAGSPDSAEAVRLAGAVQRACIDEDLLTLTCGPIGAIVRIIPPLTVTADEVATGTERFIRAVERVVGG
ncbi:MULTISPECIES: aspartate aminotransferase family protein [Gordonia]|uniref:(S)-3-amino-2-methylpropionate transaminase n=2 Tax=Gordonia TaxID=2053 RepID=L7LIZ8_9ACTN|nr:MULTISPECIES: aspartate aminotransferase family protein [Gordonia]KXT58130.1 4-aminobutyrate aminotransferase [Gordonia sp. QH-12]WFN92401.1 aspartate aminotransferase family protein [Gordonia sihwensis]GAC60716.1 4-aminobutyrate aminotransferase [Gordonia sihwensis NBRC 108236]